eukprot:UN01137
MLLPQTPNTYSLDTIIIQHCHLATTTIKKKNDNIFPLPSRLALLLYTIQINKTQ